MTETNNLRLKKFESTDNFDYEVLNENWDAVSDVASNPNLLDNTDFSNPINQRGIIGDISSMSGTSYHIDRWLLYTSATSINLSTSSNGAKYSGINKLFFIGQYLENPSQYIGKTMTLSVKYKISGSKNGTDIDLYFIEEGGQAISYAKELDADGEWHIASITTIMPQKSDLTRMGCFINAGYKRNTEHESWTSHSYDSPTGENIDVEIAWVKFEEGDRPTVWQKPDYATELMKCQRYYQKIDDIYGFATSISSAVLDTDYIPFMNQMRAIPTVVNVSNFKYRKGSQSYATVSSANIALVSLTKNGISFRANLSGLTSDFQYGIRIDSILVSADL